MRSMLIPFRTVNRANDETPEPEDSALSLDDFASISAAIAEGDRSVDEILRGRDLTLGEWDAISAHHHQRIALDAMENDPPTLAETYAAAFTRAQDALKPVPKLTPEEWAAVSHEVASKGEDALAGRGLRRPDFLRLSRHWAAEVAKSPPLARRVFAASYALEKKRPKG